MTATLLAIMLSSALLCAALGGPWLLRRAASALSSTPRIAAGALSITAVLWIAALVALGPMLAWISNGPTWLPQHAANVCERCLNAANAATPFADSALSLGIPAVIPLALPVIGVIAVVLGLIREFQHLKRSQSALAATVREASEPITLQGYRVRLTWENTAHAFALPQRYGGIVISRGAVSTLSTSQLGAVLEHEQAHLSQRHHLCLAVLNGLTQYFRWIPLIRAVREAVPHNLEIAADHAAQTKQGTTALAGALLKLGQPSTPATASSVLAHSVLHMAGSERIRHLVGQPRPRMSVVLAGAAGAYALMLATAITAVHWPYLLAVLTGC